MKLILSLLLAAFSAQAQVTVQNGVNPALYGLTNIVVISNNLIAAQVDGLVLSIASSVGTSGGMLDIRSNALPSFPAGHQAAAMLINAGWSVKCDGPLISQDTTFAVNGDGTWKLTVASHGSGTTYNWQWYDPNNDWTDSGQTGVTYDNPPRNESSALDPDLQRLYRCAVTRNGNTVNSTETLLPVPMISEQPSGADLTVGDTFSTECVGSAQDGLGGLAVYSWTKNGSVVGGQASPQFQLTNVQVGDAGSYRCVITMPNGAKKTSSAAVLTVTP
jgi:hypothetical protein